MLFYYAGRLGRQKSLYGLDWTSGWRIVNHWVLFIMPKISEISVGIQMEGSFRFLLTGIFGITSGGGSHISVRTFRPKLAVP